MGISLHLSYVRNYSYTSVLYLVQIILFIRLPYEIRLFLCMPLRHIGEWKYSYTHSYFQHCWSGGISFLPHPLLLGKGHLVPIEEVLNGYQSWSGCFEGEKSFVPQTINSPFLSCPVCGLVPILSMLFHYTDILYICSSYLSHQWQWAVLHLQPSNFQKCILHILLLRGLDAKYTEAQNILFLFILNLLTASFHG